MATGDRAKSDNIRVECPICGFHLTRLEQYIKHVGYHIEQLALFALSGMESNLGQDHYINQEESSVPGFNCQAKENKNLK